MGPARLTRGTACRRSIAVSFTVLGRSGGSGGSGRGGRARRSVGGTDMGQPAGERSSERVTDMGFARG